MNNYKKNTYTISEKQLHNKYISPGISITAVDMGIMIEDFRLKKAKSEALSGVGGLPVEMMQHIALNQIDHLSPKSLKRLDKNVQKAIIDMGFEGSKKDKVRTKRISRKKVERRAIAINEQKEKTQTKVESSPISKEKAFIDLIREGPKSENDLIFHLPKQQVKQYIEKYQKLGLIFLKDDLYYWYSSKTRTNAQNFIEHAKELANSTYQIGYGNTENTVEKAAIEKSIVEHLKTGYYDIYELYQRYALEKSRLVALFKTKGSPGAEKGQNQKINLTELKAQANAEDKAFQAFNKIYEELAIKLSELRAIIKYDPSKLKGECYICRDE